MTNQHLNTRTNKSTPVATPRRCRLWLFLSAVCLALKAAAAPALDARGGQFIGLKSFSAFKQMPGALACEIVLTSPEITTRINWDELIASWNAETPDGAYLKVEARAVHPAGPTKFYTMGLWSPNTNCYPRESLLNQKDADGDVATDTLMLKQPCDRLQIRLTLGGGHNQKPKLKFLGLHLTDTTVTPSVLPSNPAALGKTIPAPERSQLAYTNGGVLCSPTTASMIMTYWSQRLKRPELDHDVPDIVNAIYDAKWKGTGNWPFNTAYAGSYRGMRAYVGRMSDLAEVEDWIAAGIPVGLSVCSDRLHPPGTRPERAPDRLRRFHRDRRPRRQRPGNLQEHPPRLSPQGPPLRLVVLPQRGLSDLPRGRRDPERPLRPLGLMDFAPAIQPGALARRRQADLC